MEAYRVAVMGLHRKCSCHHIFQSLVADLPLTLPSFHAIILLHLLHVAMFESFCAKYSHTFDRLPFGLFSVKRLMASFVCACLLFTVISEPVPIQPVPTRTEMQRRFR